jgi:3-deoxy-D-manno-octulosonic-acid transferase
MGRSVRLTAYRTLSRRKKKLPVDTDVPRPDRELVWIHAPEPGSHLAIEDLAARLCRVRHGLSVLITLPDTAALNRFLEARRETDTLILREVPSEHPDSVVEFLAHWRPDLCLWAWGALRPNLVLETAARGCPMALIDTDLEGFDGTRDRWLPEMSRSLLECFKVCFARTPAAQRRLRALGMLRTKVFVSPPLRAGGQALPCRDRQLAEIRDLLSGRPVWLACAIQAEEIAIVLDAHRRAARLSHRLLLVVHPAAPDLSGPVRDQIRQAGLRLADWSAGEDPDESTQVLLTEEPADLGLFYRVAPVSFIGGSLVPGFGGRDPFEAAALGSAVLYGPSVRRFLPSYTRLANAGAARIVKDAETLGTAVTRLIAPDQAASMACAGWDVISEGAATMDRLVDLVERALDGDERLADANA